MKLSWPKIRIREKFKGFWVNLGGQKPKRFTLGEKSWIGRCRHYTDLLDTHPLARSCVDGIAGRVLEEGVFLEASGDYERAEDAKVQCEELNDRIGIESLLYDTISLWIPHGSCFWEKTDTPVFDARLIPNQELIEPMHQDDIGNITRWRQNTWGSSSKPEWGNDELIHFAWNVTSKSWPYGTSMFVGCEDELDALEQLIVDIKEHMHKTAFPQTAVGVGDQTWHPTTDEVDEIKRGVRKWEPGEIHATSYPLTSVTISGGQTIANLSDILNFMYDSITDRFGVAPISKLYNSTYASSQEMQQMEKARRIAPMQRVIAWKLQNELYKPYLEDLGYSVRVCPKVKWQSEDANRVEDGEYWAMQVQAGIVPREYAAEQQGFDLEKLEEYWQKEQKRKEEAMQLQKIQFQQRGKQEIEPEQDEQ